MLLFSRLPRDKVCASKRSEMIKALGINGERCSNEGSFENNKGYKLTSHLSHNSFIRITILKHNLDHVSNLPCDKIESSYNN